MRVMVRRERLLPDVKISLVEERDGKVVVSVGPTKCNKVLWPYRWQVCGC